MWINHLDLVPGDVDVQTSFNSTTSGLGTGLSGLIIIIKSTTVVDTSTSGGNKVVEKGVEVPRGFAISGVRICCELSAAAATGSFIDQIRLAQLQEPPSTAVVLLDDATPQNSFGPVCANSTTGCDSHRSGYRRSPPQPAGSVWQHERQDRSAGPRIESCQGRKWE